MKTQKRFVISGKFKRLAILGICLILVALFALTAHAQPAIQVNPGTPGEAANDLSWSLEEPALVFDVVFSDNKTCEFPPGLWVIQLYAYVSPGQAFVGELLDAAGDPIPGAVLVGSTPIPNDLGRLGVIDLSGQTGPTVFSGIRLFGDWLEPPISFNLLWLNEQFLPKVGQTEAMGEQPPVAEAGAPVTGTAGVPVSFDGSASFDPDGGDIVQYDWDFGDGNSGTGENPSHTYTDSNTYNVTLTVTDEDGFTNSDTTTATIGESSTSPTADGGGPYMGTAGVEVFFNGTASSDPEGNPLQYDWDFGDGTSGTGPTPSHTYATSGTYNVTLTVSDNDAETDSDTTTATIAIANQPPAANAGGPYSGTEGEAVDFDGSLSFDPEEEPIVRYDWYFGDGFIALDAGPTPKHTYQAAGLYSVTVTVTDDGGLPNSDSTTARIGKSSRPPTADANGPYNGRVGVAVSFDGSGSSDPDDDIVRYDWYFGDGFIALDAGPTSKHDYLQAGKYIVKLTVTDESGETDTDITVATVGIGNLSPQADAGDSVSGRVRRDITFDGTGSSDQDGIIKSYDWHFGDGNSGTGRTPTHVYDEPGTYFVTLTVTDSDGATNSDATLAVIKSRFECVEECRADKFECLDAAFAAKETCIESCDDDHICKRACRSVYRIARSECRAEFRACRATCR